MFDALVQAKARRLAVKKLSGTKFRQMLRAGEDIPEWFAFKCVTLRIKCVVCIQVHGCGTHILQHGI